MTVTVYRNVSDNLTINPTLWKKISFTAVATLNSPEELLQYVQSDQGGHRLIIRHNKGSTLARLPRSYNLKLATKDYNEFNDTGININAMITTNTEADATGA